MTSPGERKTCEVIIRNVHPDDFPHIIELCAEVYRTSRPWSLDQLASHLRVFPDGQLVAEHVDTGKIVGFSASLIVFWDDYEFNSSWREFTDRGYFTNHDPERGRTLYGAEIMVHPSMQGCGIGKMIYAARRELVKRLRLKRIRAGARLRGYSKHADNLSPIEYVQKVISGELTDATLTFQLRQGFAVCAVVGGYLQHDPESLGYAAVIEWLNPDQEPTPDRPGLNQTLIFGAPKPAADDVPPKS